VFARNYGVRQIEPEIWLMRHSLPLRKRINWRVAALLIAILALGLAGVLFYDGGETRNVTALGHELGADWTCTPNLIGTVCVRDVTTIAAKR